jgi:16S rRNA (uracil1498-N3)-methyltransferase
VRLRRIFVESPLTAGAHFKLDAAAAGHVVRVLRLRAGDALTLFNGAGGEYPGTIEAIAGSAVTVSLGAHQSDERESPLEVTLAQGVSRGERMDLVVQKATELGVTRLIPVLTERSVVRLTDDKAQRRTDHWRAIAIAACEQCARNRIPQIAAPISFTAFLRGQREEKKAQDCVSLLLSPAGVRRISELGEKLARVSVLIGPEGGLTAQEQEAAIGAGFTPVRLGPRVLRTETAALAALALLQREFGDF